MSRSVDNIIPVTWNIKRSGIGAVSFGVALAAYGDATTPEDQVMGLFTSYEDLLERHPNRADLLGVGQNWFESGGSTLITIGYEYTATPPEPAAASTKKATQSTKTAVEVTPQSVAMEEMAERLAKVQSLSSPKNFVEAMMKAADSSWFYFPFSTQTPSPLTQDEWENAVSWCDANSRFLSMTIKDAKAIDPGVTDDLGSYIKSLGYRRCSLAYTTKNDYMGVRMAGMMGMTDYTQPNSYKDAEYKSINQAPDELGGTDIATLIAKGYYFNTEIAAKASNTPAMLQNTVSTSQYGETIAEVMGTDSYLINLQNSLLNVVTGQTNLPQTPEGQQLAITAANQLGEKYINNGFLGQREVIHPTTKETVITRGYITTTVPEDVYKLTDAERGEHKLYPLTQYIYRAGSAWTVAATVNVW